MVVLGTRPEAIKLAPVILEALQRKDRIDLTVCSTGQHKEMLEQALSAFEIKAGIELSLMRKQQSLPDLTARLIRSLSRTFTRSRPDTIVVQGDTTTAFAATLSAFYQKIPVAHVEAGLRTGNLESPFPEELNRILISRMATWHFPPTRKASHNLLNEGVSPESIHVTGNTVVDAIELIRSHWSREQTAAEWKGILPDYLCASESVLVTAHRRENMGYGLEQICLAIRTLSADYPDTEFIFPVHMNPQVRKTVFSSLSSIKNIKLVEPVDFETNMKLQSQSRLIITDSGGIQEEAPSFGVPVVVMREHTERREGVDAGFATLAGTEAESIIKASRDYLDDPGIKKRLACLPNPYGDGEASGRILSVILGEQADSFHG